jgi:hypothetical protein
MLVLDLEQPAPHPIEVRIRDLGPRLHIVEVRVAVQLPPQFLRFPDDGCGNGRRSLRGVGLGAHGAPVGVEVGADRNMGRSRRIGRVRRNLGEGIMGRGSRRGRAQTPS